MPELALVFFVGCVLTALLASVHFYLGHRRFHSLELRILNQNLAAIGSVWLESQSRVEKLQEGAREQDYKNFVRSTMIAGAIFSLWSWAGFVMQALMMLSVWFLSRPRLEKRIWASDLVRKQLSKEEVFKIYEEIGSY